MKEIKEIKLGDTIELQGEIIAFTPDGYTVKIGSSMVQIPEHHLNRS